MRLIDADEFKRQIAAVAIKDGTSKSVDKANVLFDLIDLQPTAYNIEEVVQQLEQEKIVNINSDETHAKTWNNAIKSAVDCIRNGGKADVLEINVGNNGWIPVNKKLPDVGITVLCYWKKIDWYDNTTCFYYTLMHRNADVEWISEFGKCTSEVLAWQPLPKPYAGEN